MRKACALIALVAGLLVVTPAPAAADATLFWGFSPTPANRSLKGFSFGVGLVVVGFEFEYANTNEDEFEAAPGLRTGMFNVMAQTPTRLQLYVTAGGGVFRERFRDLSETNFGTNIGGGVKIPIAGPFRVRVDYRLFNLRGGDALYSRPQRFYVGGNIAF